MTSNPNLEDDEIQQSKSPLRTMTKLTLAVMWIALFIAVWWNQSTVPADPWWVLGMPVCGLITFAVLYGPAEVKLASPHGISRLHSDSIKSNNPLKTIAAIPGRPELGIYSFGSVDAPHFGIGTFVGTRELIVVPTKLAMRRGRNLDINCQTQDYTDHTQLPPDVFVALQELDEYRPDMHVEYGLWPEDNFKLGERDKKDFIDTLKYTLENEYGNGSASEKILRELFKKMDELANTVSPFSYDPSLTGTIQNFMMREKSLNHEVIKLSAAVRQWESMYSKAMKTANPKTPPPPIGPVERITTMVPGGQGDQENGGGYSG